MRKGENKYGIFNPKHNEALQIHEGNTPKKKTELPEFMKKQKAIVKSVLSTEQTAEAKRVAAMEDFLQKSLLAVKVSCNLYRMDR